MGTTAAPPREAFDLIEAVTTKPSPLADDGTVTIHVMRPGLGLGKGNHRYPAKMLQENAHKFAGWRVFVDHLSPEARRALGGLPRSMHDLGGMLEESWWDGSVPAEGRFEQGAVVGRLKPIRELREVVEELPEAVEFSIRAKATDVKPQLQEGKEEWVVEGIDDTVPGSVDAVTEAGAGGRIAEMINKGMQEGRILEEARALDEEIEEAQLDSKTRNKLPDSAFAIPESRSYPIHDEGHARNALSRVAQHGSPDDQKKVRGAVKRRYPNLKVGSDDKSVQETKHNADEGGDEVAELEEALRDPESGVAKQLGEMIDSRVESQVEERLNEEREEREESHQRELQEAREQASTDAKAEANRQVQLRDLRHDAHKQIEEAKLPEALQKRLTDEFDLDDAGEPKPKLDVSDEVDSDGKVTKTAKALLQESVQTAIGEERDLVLALNPTKVRGQGASSNNDGEKGAAAKREPGYHHQLLQEAGFTDPDEVLGIKAPEKEIDEAGRGAEKKEDE